MILSLLGGILTHEILELRHRKQFDHPERRILMEKKTIGGFIAALRKANGMTQKELAEQLNVSDKTVSRWERDDGAPDLATIPAIAEIFKQKETGIEIESFGDEIDYREILLVLTANGSTYENYDELTQTLIKDSREFLTEIIRQGQKNREIRQDLTAEDIAESLIIMYMGIQYKWEVYLIDDMISDFEDNFNLEWEKIRFRQ